MRYTEVIILLLTFFRTSLGFSFNDVFDSVNDLTTSSTCSPCQSQEVPSAMTIVHSDGLSINVKFNSTLQMAWEKITSAYVTNYYKSSSTVTGLGCTTEYQYVEKTEYSWTIYFTLHLEYDTSTTISAIQIAQSAFSSLETYNSYLAQLNLSLITKEVICESTPFPTKAPVVTPTLPPTKAPVTKTPVTEKPVTKKPVTDSPTKKPTKKPATDSPTQKPVASPTVAPVQATTTTNKPTKAPVPQIESASSSPTMSPTKLDKVVIPSSMTITSNFTLNFDFEFIAKWEQTTSEYYTYYYQNATNDSNAVCYAKYLNYEYSEGVYIIYFVLHVEVQYSLSYSYSSTEVTNIVQNTFSTKTTRMEYSVIFMAETKVQVKCKGVEYSTRAPTQAPVEASSPTSSPITKSLVASTVEGSFNFTTSIETKIDFSSQVIAAFEKSTSWYITRYYAYNDNVQDLQVTANYQGSKVLYECGCTTIVYFSFDVSYSSSTYTASEIVVQPFDTRLSRLAYSKVLSKVGFQIELEGTSLEDTYSNTSGNSVNAINSPAARISSTGLISIAVGAFGSLAVFVL